MIKNLIVGSGISGITLANKIATELQQEVVIIEEKNHIGGNCFDYYEDNICVHKYGTHIFHTNLTEVWSYLSQFTQWRPYMHQVKGCIDGQIIPIPFNLKSIEKIFPKYLSQSLIKKLIDKYGFNQKVTILALRESGDEELKYLSDFIYEKVFLNYTLKQWDLKPEQLDPAVTGRVPVYISYDERYFQDKYQGIPLHGYTKMMEKMLDNPLIKVLTNTTFEQFSQDNSYEKLFYTGQIDRFFNYEFGELPYRSLHFDFIKLEQEYFQSQAVINYPNNYDFTRIGEYKYFLNDKSANTIISLEYPQKFELGKNIPYYPIIQDENLDLYKKYYQKAKTLKNIYFLGRLGDYKYYDMDKAVARALFVFAKIAK